MLSESPCFRIIALKRTTEEASGGSGLNIIIKYEFQEAPNKGSRRNVYFLPALHHSQTNGEHREEGVAMILALR
ncbi:hypothetical protein ACQP3C_28675, partial [Escherichia coli]